MDRQSCPLLAALGCQLAAAAPWWLLELHSRGKMSSRSLFVRWMDIPVHWMAPCAACLASLTISSSCSSLDSNRNYSLVSDWPALCFEIQTCSEECLSPPVGTEANYAPCLLCVPATWTTTTCGTPTSSPCPVSGSSCIPSRWVPGIKNRFSSFYLKLSSVATSVCSELTAVFSCQSPPPPLPLSLSYLTSSSFRSDLIVQVAPASCTRLKCFVFVAFTTLNCQTMFIPKLIMDIVIF